MEYEHIVYGKFISRPNRFIAMVEVDGEVVRCHVKNTGRCKELLIPGAKVILHKPPKGKRATEYDLISVYKGDMLINMDSQAPNKIAKEYIEASVRELINLKSEVTYGDSRFDFLMNTHDENTFIEVKGVTLENNGIAMFPDAPTARGVKHIKGLINAVKNGYKAKILFVIQMQGIKHMTPNWQTHPELGEALKKAYAEGVEICAIDCKVSEGKVEYGEKVPVVLE